MPSDGKKVIESSPITMGVRVKKSTRRSFNALCNKLDCTQTELFEGVDRMLKDYPHLIEKYV